MKKALLLFSVATLLVSGAISSPAAVKADLSQPTQGINITESWKFITAPPSLMSSVGTGVDAIMTLCTTLTDDACSKGNAINALNHLPPCISPITVNCISSVYALDAAGTKTEGTFVKYATPDYKYNYPASETNNLPQGKSQGGIWQIPGITHSGGTDLYYASTYLNGWLEKSMGAKVTNEKFFFNSMESAINPIKEIMGDFQQAIPLDSSNPSRDGSRSGGVGASINLPAAEKNSCVMIGGGICYSAQEFPKEFRFGMKVVLGNSMKGWFHGRIFQPVIDVQSNGDGQIVSFEALPVQVPTLYERVNTSELSAEFKSYLGGNRIFSEGSGYFMPGNAGQDAIEMAGFWLPLVKDKASTSRTYWNVRTLDGGQDSDISRCSDGDGKLAGIVTTNSLVYSAGPPKYNKAEGSLDYKVLSPHLTAAGDVAVGSYDLVLRSDVARCIYGFSKAPIQAVVSIVSPDGENKVATTLIREKNGWITLSANGFTFSSPTIRVVLSQEAEATPVASPTPAASPAPLIKKTTISCVKGKATKKLTALKPKCPIGFKKK
jgi:hypothetical protein